MHSHIDGLVEELDEEDMVKRFSADAEKFKNSLVSLEGDFYVDEGEANIREDISTLSLHISQYPGMPSDGQINKTKELSERMDRVKAQLDDFMTRSIKVNERLVGKGLAPIVVRTIEEYLED